MLPLVFLHGGRVHSQRRADPGARAAAAADRGAEGARLRQRGDRLALLEDGRWPSASSAWRSGSRAARGSAGLIIELYNKFFRFPELLFSVPVSVIIGATALTLIAAGAGAFSAVRRAVRVPPAEAMRPEAPARYRRSLLETPWVSRRLGTAGRMVLRNVTRHPLRAAASIFGIGFAVAILMIGFVFADAIDKLIETQFWVAERQDVTVGFVEPRVGCRPTRARPLARRHGRRAAAHGRGPGPLGLSRAVSRPDRRAARFPHEAHRRSRRPAHADAGLRRRHVADPGRRARRGDRRQRDARSARGRPAGASGAGDRARRRHHGALDVHGARRGASADAGGRRGVGRAAADRSRARGGAVAGAEGDCRPWPAPGSSVPSCKASARPWPPT